MQCVRRLLILVKDGVDFREDRRLDPALAAQPVKRLGGAMPLDHSFAAGKQLGHGLSRADLFAELAIAAPRAVARRDKIAEAAEAVKSFRLRTQRRADADHFR